MKKSLINKYLIILVLVLIVALTAVGCEPDDEADPLDTTALNAEIALEITSQGDYTTASFDAYKQKLATAKQLASDTTATQNAIDKATTELTKARLALEIRSVELVDGANTQLKLNSGESKQIIIADYINTNNLSKITFKVMASNDAVVLSEVIDGKFTITADVVQGELDAKVSINVYYDNVAKRSAELSVKIINEVAPTVTSQEVVKVYDMVSLGNVDSITIDFAENVNNVGNLPLTYSAKLGDETLALDGTLYTFELGSYTAEITYETFTVTISCMVNGKPTTVEYIYKLGLKDTISLSMANGNFENGLEGWTVVGNIGNVSTDTHYWLNDPESAEGFAFGMDGEKMFSAYVEGAQESAVGTLTSPTFTLSGSGFVTFKVGAMKDGNYVYVDVVDANSGEILARYYNGLWADRTNGAKSGCTLVAYKADLSAHLGKELFFRISDNADSGYGLFFADSFITYYESEPTEGFNDATPVNYQVSGTIYDLFNGGFELGDVQGWWNIGEIGVVTNATGYWGDNIAYGKDGEFLFTGVESNGADTMREANKGTLTSSTFQIGGTGYISYMLGGGGNENCYIQVIDSTTGEVLAKFRQQAQQDAKLIQYVADLSAHMGKTVRIQVVDQAENGWGCVSFDNVVTYYPQGKPLPENAITANDIKDAHKYVLANGSFENGLDGWTMDITEAGAHNTLGWVLDTEIDAGWYTKNTDRKEGNNLFTFVKPDDTNCESSKGTLTSATFTLKKDSYVSFRFGGAGTRDVYIQLVNADGTVIATFYNDPEGKVNTEMYAYFYQYTGETADCFFRVADNSTSNYGCFVVDDFRVNLDTAPDGFVPAIVE